MAYAAIRDKIVAAAMRCIGLVGGTGTGDDEFIRYYNSLCGTNFSLSSTPYCAIFVTYHLRTNDVPTWVCPNFAGCTTVNREFLIPTKFGKNPSSYTPKPADLIFFNWNGKRNGTFHHVGFVEKVVGNTVYTIEGNSTNSTVRHKSYSAGSAYIAGYGALPYESIDTLDNPFPVPTLVKNGTTGTAAYWAQFELKLIQKYNIAIDGAFGPASVNAAKQFQIANKLDADGVIGAATIKALQESHKKKVTPVVTPTPTPTPSTPSTPSTTEKEDPTEEMCQPTKIRLLKQFQTWLNNNYRTGLVVDGIWGPASCKGTIKALQTELNRQVNARLSVDGIWGPRTKAACDTLHFGCSGKLTMLAQGLLTANGYDVSTLDGVFGPNMMAALKRFQADFRIGTVFTRGTLNPATWEKLVKF